MKKIKIFSLIALMLLILAAGAFAQNVGTLGRNPFYAPGLNTKEDLIRMIESEEVMLREGFMRLDLNLYESLKAQISETDIEEVEIPKGTQFHWMFFKSRGIVAIINDAKWVGRNAFKAFKFDIDNGGLRYTFVVPLECGNIALLGVADAPREIDPVNIPPVCKLEVSPKEIYVGDMITADASKSYDEDGSVEQVIFHLLDATGAEVDRKAVMTEPFKTKFKIDKIGSYSVKVMIVDNKGAVCADPCLDPFTVIKKENVAPTCNVVLSDSEVYAGDMITADASGSNDSDGNIKNITFYLFDAAGNELDKKVVTNDNYTCQFMVPSAGNFSVRALVEDNEGAVSMGGCEASFRGISFGGPIVDFGGTRQPDPAWYTMARIGYEHYWDRNWSTIISVGGFIHSQGSEGETAFVVDAFMNYNFDNGFYYGVGVGAWITDGDDDLAHEDSQADFIYHIGMRIMGEASGFNTSIFFEGRTGFDEFDEFVELGRFTLGLRFRF